MSRACIAALAAALLVLGACADTPTEPGAEPAAGEDSTPASLATTTSITSATSATSATGTDSATAPTTLQVAIEPEPEPARAPEPDAPADAPSLAASLLAAESAIRDPAVGAEQAAAWGRYQQRLYLHLARNPDWVDEVLAVGSGADPILGRAIEANWTARVNLDALVTSEDAHTEVPAWRIVAPRPVDELLGYYRDGEGAWSIDWEYLAAINLIETRMGRIEGISTAGAVGPMQFLPTTWAECCDGDPTDPADAIPGAARYLTIRGGPENMERAIWGYNNSDRYVAAVTAYAAVLADDELAYRGYHAWEIYFRSTEGLLWLPVGYEELRARPATDWLAANPTRLIDG